MGLDFEIGLWTLDFGGFTVWPFKLRGHDQTLGKSAKNTIRNPRSR